MVCDFPSLVGGNIFRQSSTSCFSFYEHPFVVDPRGAIERPSLMLSNGLRLLCRMPQAQRYATQTSKKNHRARATVVYYNS